MYPRRFALVRHIDYTGVSGVGVVAYGVVFFDGQVALRWCSDHPATSLWSSIEDLLAVHGHGDATSVQWIDDVSDRLQETMEAMQSPATPRGRRARKSTDAEPPPPPPADPPRSDPPPVDDPLPSWAPPSTDPPVIPSQRRTGGRHRRHTEPSEESAVRG